MRRVNYDNLTCVRAARVLPRENPENRNERLRDGERKRKRQQERKRVREDRGERTLDLKKLSRARQRDLHIASDLHTTSGRSARAESGVEPRSSEILTKL